MTNRAVCTSTGAPQGSRHAGRWHQAALSETVNNHGFDLQRVQAIGQQAHRAPDGAPVHHERHRPEQTTLYRLVKQHVACFFGQVVCRAGRTRCTRGCRVRPILVTEQEDIAFEDPKPPQMLSRSTVRVMPHAARKPRDPLDTKPSPSR